MTRALTPSTMCAAGNAVLLCSGWRSIHLLPPKSGERANPGRKPKNPVSKESAASATVRYYEETTTGPIRWPAMRYGLTLGGCRPVLGPQTSPVISQIRRLRHIPTEVIPASRHSRPLSCDCPGALHAASEPRFCQPVCFYAAASTLQGCGAPDHPEAAINLSETSP